MTQEALKMALQVLEDCVNSYGMKYERPAFVKAITAIKEALAQPEQKPVGDDWTPCMKLPVVVYVRKQRLGESHVSTREGITPVKPDDLIMRGVSGEEYPIGRAIFEQTYSLNTAPPQRTEQEPVAWRTFDGEGGYDYRSYEDNESYADDWNKRNPNHSGWVDKLYTPSKPEQEPVAKYSDIVSDGGLDPRNKFNIPPQRTEQEPVAHIPLKALEQIKSPMLVLNNVPIYGYSAEGTVAVYTTPPQRTFVGLATEDRLTAKYMQDAPDGIEAVIDYIEAKLKEKNT